MNKTLGSVLRMRADQHGGRRVFTFLTDGEARRKDLSYGELDLKARAIGNLLCEYKARKERALLLYPPGFEFIEAFLGCLYNGTIAVPVYPPDPTRLDRSIPRFLAIIKDAQ